MIPGLAIETSGQLGSVAITEDGVVVAEDSFAHGLRHAAEMVPRIDRLLKDRGWTPSHPREIYISIGPGSFTGLRIGITLAKTLAFVSGAKIVAVQTLEVLAGNAPPEAANLILVLDAKRDQIFTARFYRDDSGGEWMVREPAHLDSLADMISRSPRPVHLLGEGIPFHEQFIPRDDASVIITHPDTWRARAAAVADIGHRLARAGQFTDPQALLPLYIRKPEAEEKFDANEAARAGVNHKA